MKTNQAPRSVQFILVFVLYQCLWHVLFPWALLRLWWKGKKEIGYRQHILERFGFYSSEEFANAVWIHAVSVGETRAAAPLIELLIASGYKVLLTHMTPTGRATGGSLFAEFIASRQLAQCYLPYDFCWPVSRFYRKYKPQLGLLMETEVWPSLLFFARKRFPIQLINGRLSLKSSLSFAKFGSLSRDLFGMFDSILAQSWADQKRYEQFGVKHCVVTGNLKFDVQLPKRQIEEGQQWQQTLSKKIICAASTRDGEEKIILKAWLRIPQENRPLLVIVPRHLPRVSEISALLDSEGLSYVRRSDMEHLQDIPNEVLIGDSMGEMALYLSAAHLVVMGGSWMGTGGQNLIEPISLGKPVLVGPSMYNFSQITKEAVASGIVVQIHGDSDAELSENLGESFKQFMMTDSMIRISELSKSYAKNHQGATQKTIENLKLKSNEI
jgi:3-deoxy-D-manno-octulosonic-acid transferase